MNKIVVEHSPNLEGRVRISGAKNATLPILAACLLGTEDIILEDVPHLSDIDTMCEVLRLLGSEVEWVGKGTLKINSANVNRYETDMELMSKMRAAITVMGPLLGRLRRAKNYMPGGCAIGKRPIDLHLKGFKALGARIQDEGDYIMAVTDGLVGANIYLDFPSVGATQNIMMAACLADGDTVIDNAAKEPEIVDLSNFLRKLGADVTGAGTSKIRIRGVERLGGARHQVIPDRIEAGTFMVAAAITGGDITVENVIASHIYPVIAKLKETGCDVVENKDTVRVVGVRSLKPFEIKTLPYPGFPTDMQAQMMALMSVIPGNSKVIETVFENRFMHVAEFEKMGAKIIIDGKEARISGGKLKGAQVKATDLRAGAALILAGLAAEGTTEIINIHHIDRGYEDIENKFRRLGASIIRKEME